MNKTFPNRHTDLITIGRDPALTYSILKAVAKRRAHIPFTKRAHKWIVNLFKSATHETLP